MAREIAQTAATRAIILIMAARPNGSVAIRSIVVTHTDNPMAPEDTLTAPVSQKRIEANRRNARKSTGPTSSEGKSRSRFNGLKHGLAAKVPVLPGEDPAEFEARVAGVVESYTPGNQVELDLLEQVATTAWALDRARRAEVAHLRHRARHDPLDREARERDEALALGERLLWNPRGVWQAYPHDPAAVANTRPWISWSENPDELDQPARLVLQLERTVAGCRWLLDRWAELKARLEPGQVWVGSDQYKATRLLGKQPMDAFDDPEVGQIFMAGHALNPAANTNDPFAAEHGDPAWKEDGDRTRHIKTLEQERLQPLQPADAGAARLVARLNLILARNQEIADADAAEAPARLAFDASPDGDKLRRYALASARLFNQTLTTFLRIRKGLATDSAESSVVDGPLPVDDGSFSVQEIGVDAGSSCVEEMGVDDRSSFVEEVGVAGGSLSVDEMDVAGGSLSAEEMDVAGGSLLTGLRTEPILESSLVGGPSTVAAAEDAISGRDAILRTEAKTDFPAGEGFGESARRSCEPADTISRPARRLGQYGIPDFTKRAWEEVMGEILSPHSRRALQALAEAERAPRKQKKQAKARARKARSRDTGPKRPQVTENPRAQALKV
jgi:hypothetical protein